MTHTLTLPSPFIGERQNTPKLCFGDGWRVGLEAAAAASASKKTTLVSCANTPQLCCGDGDRACFMNYKSELAFLQQRSEKVALSWIATA